MKRLAALAAAAVVALWVAPAHAAVVSHYAMTETSGTVMHDDVDSHNGVIGPLVRLTGATGYDFPGWQNNVQNGRLFGTVPAAGSIVTVQDPTKVFDGDNVSVRLKARLVNGHLPTQAVGGAVPSYNVVQKGKAKSQGGFWKMEVTNAGKLRCTAANPSTTKAVVSTPVVADGNEHLVACNLAGGKLTVTVDGVSKSVNTTIAPHPTGKFAYVSIGKKPGSTDPSDAFSGNLRDLTFSG